jgi:plastocyanin
MQTSALFRLRPVLVASLALVAAMSAQLTYSAPDGQVSLTSDQSVSIDSFAFAPPELSVPVGATLTWANAQAGIPHTSSSVDGLWDSGVLSTGDTFSFTFNQVGDFVYECNIHPSMRGIVHVEAEVGATTTDTDTSAVGAQALAAPTPIAQSVAPETSQPPMPTAISVPSPTPTVFVPAVTPTAPPARYYGH